MIRPSIRLVCVSLFVLLAFPVRALADNCSSRFDCFDTVAAAAAAAAGAGVAAGLGSIPRVKRRPVDPCKMANALFWFAVLVTLVFIGLGIFFLLRILPPLILALETPGFIIAIITILVCLAVLSGLAGLAGFLWSEYFRYRADCQASTP